MADEHLRSIKICFMKRPIGAPTIPYFGIPDLRVPITTSAAADSKVTTNLSIRWETLAC